MMALQDVQQRIPWIMKPVELFEVLVTPERWFCGRDTPLSRLTNALVPDTTWLGRILSRVCGLLSPVRSRLLSRSPRLLQLDWRLRQAFWTMVWTGIAGLQRWPRKAVIPREEKPISMLSAPESYPDFRAPTLVVPSDVPCGEKSLVTELAVQGIQLMQDIYPVVASHQPVASHDPHERLRQTYTRLHRFIRRPPRWHPDLDDASRGRNLLGALAVGGPFAKLLERCPEGEGRYMIDLQHFANYAVRPGLCHLGSKIHFVVDGGHLKVSGIDYEGKHIAPGEPTWEHAERIALAGLMTHTTVWRQGMEYHVGGLAPIPIIVHNMPPAHPIRRLLAAHTAQTLLTNHSTHLTLRRSGWDVKALSFPYDTILRYYDDGARGFDIRRLDVRADAERRNIPSTLHYPYLTHALRYWNAIETYVREYVTYYYPDTASLAGDRVAHDWFNAVDRAVVHGIRGYVPSLTVEDLIRLGTVIIYSVSVAHTENSLWHYAPFIPTTVRQDGQGQLIGELQMTLDFQLLITSPTTLLLNDVSHLALDPGAAQIMRRFHTSLMTLQREMEGMPDRYWRILPREIEASVSG